jgi:DNA-binding response OmpR family regulator
VSKILVVDDDLALADVITFSLRRAGFLVVLAHDGQGALEQYSKELPDLILLDWSLPNLDGLEVCHRVRAESNVPIIMLTVHSTDDDVVAALDAGADEYITKPFSPRQLVARIRSVLRRASGEPEITLTAGQLSLDLERHEVRFDGNPPIYLTPMETRLMRALMQNIDHVLTTESLIFRVWGTEGATRHMLKQLIYRLRNKIEPYSGDHTLIETIPNMGYILNTPPNSQ